MIGILFILCLNKGANLSGGKHEPLVTLFLIFFIALQGCASEQEKADTFIREGNAYFEKQEYAKAEIQLKNALKLTPDSVQAYHLLAQAYLKQKKAQEAFGTFLRLEQLEPDNLETKLQLASIYFLANKNSEAEKKWNRSLLLIRTTSRGSI